MVLDAAFPEIVPAKEFPAHPQVHHDGYVPHLRDADFYELVYLVFFLRGTTWVEYLLLALSNSSLRSVERHLGTELHSF